MQKKYLIILLAVVLIIIILILPKPWMSKKQPVSPNKTATSADTNRAAPSAAPFVPITTIASGQIPKAMPGDLPFEKGAQILQNYELKDPTTGKTQSVRIYVSKKTLDDNYAVYQKYLKDNGWVVAPGFNLPVIKNFDATKDTARLDIGISKDDKGQVTLSVSYVN